MRVHPAIGSIKSNRVQQIAMQKRFEETLNDWRKNERTLAIAQDLQSFADGAALEDCTNLDPLLSKPIVAHEFVQNWQKSVIAALREFPLALPPFGHRCAQGLSNIVLLSRDQASLAITAFEERGEGKPPISAVFTDRQTHEIVLSGSAKGVMHEVRQCNGLDTIIDTCPAHWRTGAIIVTNGPCEARQVVCVKGSMVVLQLSRQAANPQPTREYSLHDGELLQIASGDKIASQKVMALSVLGAMAAHGEGSGALDAMLNCANEQSEVPDVRWEALRQALALNASKGIALLEDIARRDDDPLSLPAKELRDALQSDEPELARFFGAAA